MGLKRLIKPILGLEVMNTVRKGQAAQGCSTRSQIGRASGGHPAEGQRLKLRARCARQ